MTQPDIVVDGMGSSIICAAPKCTAKAISANSTNFLVTNFKLVGTSGIFVTGDNITVDSTKVMTVQSNAVEVHAVTSASLRNNHIVNADNGGVLVKISSNFNNNSAGESFYSCVMSCTHAKFVTFTHIFCSCY